jgi:hypothetical protein
MYLSLYFLIIFIIAVLIDRQRSKTTSPRLKFINSGDPIRRWLQEQAIFYESGKDGPQRNYRFNYALKTCLVLVEMIHDRHVSRCVMKIALPVIVQEERYTEVNRVIHALNRRIKPLQFRIVRNNGRIYLNADSFQIASGEEAAILLMKDILYALSVADMSFPEINRAIIGGTLPELAAIRLFGFPDHELN